MQATKKITGRNVLHNQIVTLTDLLINFPL